MVLERLHTIRASGDQDALQDYISHRQASTLKRLNVSFTLPKATNWCTNDDRFAVRHRHGQLVPRPFSVKARGRARGVRAAPESVRSVAAVLIFPPSDTHIQLAVSWQNYESWATGRTTSCGTTTRSGAWCRLRGR